MNIKALTLEIVLIKNFFGISSFLRFCVRFTLDILLIFSRPEKFVWPFYVNTISGLKYILYFFGQPKNLPFSANSFTKSVNSPTLEVKIFKKIELKFEFIRTYMKIWIFYVFQLLKTRCHSALLTMVKKSWDHLKNFQKMSILICLSQSSNYTILNAFNSYWEIVVATVNLP